jgi:hypothetical protein
VKACTVPTSDEVAALCEEYEAAPALPVDEAERGRVIRLWLDYAEWVVDRAHRLGRKYDIQRDGYEYPTAEEMYPDLDAGRLRLHPGETFAYHPLWGPAVNEANRIVHDIDGHYAARRGFSWEDECFATWEHMVRTPVKLRPVVFATQLHQLSVTTHRKQFPEVQKCLLTRHIWTREAVTPR